MSEKPAEAPKTDKPKATEEVAQESFYVPEFGVNVLAKSPDEALKKAKAAAPGKKENKEAK